MVEQLFLALILAGGQVGVSQQPESPSARLKLCQQAIAAALTPAGGELCSAETDIRVAESLPKTDSERRSRLRSAADHLRKGSLETPDPALKAVAADVLARLFDPDHLNEPGEQESALRELIRLEPAALDPLFRLAALQEKFGLIELAEDTLIGARRRQPDALEAYHQLARFYARRAAALQTPEQLALKAEPRPPAGKPDDRGIYRAGDGVELPRREGTPRYPDDAKAAGLEGVVAVEMVVGPDGFVTDARVVRSVPLLDAAAVDAVKKWRYEPTIVNGQPVPVRITTTVNFTLSR